MEELGNIEFVAAGELLYQLKGEEDKKLNNSSLFRRNGSGCTALLASYLAWLGHRTALIGTVGEDELADYLLDQVRHSGVDVSFLRRDNKFSTSISVSAPASKSPVFLRQADTQILSEQLPENLLRQTSLFATSCFALSKNPARETLLDAALRATRWGAYCCLILNYSPYYWPYRREAMEIVQEYCRTEPIIRITEQEIMHFFGRFNITIEEVFYWFRNRGASAVVILQNKARYVCNPDGDLIKFDYNGNFLKKEDLVELWWAGYLTAFHRQSDAAECVKTGDKLMSYYNKAAGNLPEKLDQKLLFAD